MISETADIYYLRVRSKFQSHMVQKFSTNPGSFPCVTVDVYFALHHACDAEWFPTVLQGSIKAVFGKDMPVLPFLLMAGADARHYVELAEGRVYRFSPTWLGPNEMSLMHGTDERIPLESLGNMCHFFSAFLESMCA